MRKYEWGEGRIPKIDVHSTKKHDVLREYLIKYITIVGGKPFHRKNLSLTLVDGFAGGGLYEKPNGEIHLGSPFIFLKSAEEAGCQLSVDKPEFKLKANYIFLDKEKQYLDFLKDSLEKNGYKDQIGKSIFLRKGLFESEIDYIIKHIIQRKGTARRCIFLLDQYGYTDVPIATIKKIFKSLPKAEIILTFAVDFLIDYLTESEPCSQILDKLGFTYNLSSLNEEKQQKCWRSAIQKGLYGSIVNQSGAMYFTNFFIKSNESHKAYWLMHLSMHPKARDEMQKLHWEMKNHFCHEGEAGFDMLGYDPKLDGFFDRQDFMFSNFDKDQSHKMLMRQIPAMVPQNGVNINDFFISQCNFTPATSTMFMDALKDLHANNEITILTKGKRRKKEGAKIRSGDTIYRPMKQIYLF